MLILARNPWVFFRRRLFGWNVRFMFSPLATPGAMRRGTDSLPCLAAAVNPRRTTWVVDRGSRIEGRYRRAPVSESGPAAPPRTESEFEADADSVRVAITDTGRPFNPLEYPPPDLDKGADRPIGGLGIHLMRSSVDEVHYRPDPAGNRLELVKKLQGRPHARPGRE